MDVVIRLREADFRGAEKVLNALGLQSRLPVTASEVFRFREEYVRNRNMRAWTFVNPSRPSEIVDVILTDDLADIDIKRVRIQNQIVRVASIADLIRMKQGILPVLGPSPRGCCEKGPATRRCSATLRLISRLRDGARPWSRRKLSRNSSTSAGMPFEEGADWKECGTRLRSNG